MKTVSREFINKAREIMDRGRVVFVNDFCKELIMMASVLWVYQFVQI